MKTFELVDAIKREYIKIGTAGAPVLMLTESGEYLRPTGRVSTLTVDGVDQTVIELGHWGWKDPE